MQGDKLIPAAMSDVAEHMIRSMPNDEGNVLVVDTHTWIAQKGDAKRFNLKFVQVHMALRFPRDFADRIKEFVPRSKVMPDDFDPPSDPEDLFLWLEADDGELLGFQIEMI